MNKIKVALFGRHANRTPMAYNSYRSLFSKYVDFVSSPYDADVVVLGYSVDMAGLENSIDELLVKRPQLKFAVISEEPLWDTLSDNSPDRNCATWQFANTVVTYFVFNHVTSSIFNFIDIPYFLTTEAKYLTRYLLAFEKILNTFDEHALYKHWHSVCKNKVQFLQQQRYEDEYAFVNRESGIWGVSKYRTQLADKLNSEGMALLNQVSTYAKTRQSLPDWHLDKLANTSNTLFMSAIENTYHMYYVTEKVFDAYAMCSIPLYHTTPTHKIFEFIEKGSFINLECLDLQKSMSEIYLFDISRSVSASYLKTIERCYKKFLNLASFKRERERVVTEVVNCLRYTLNN